MPGTLYKGYVNNVARRFDEALSKIAALHNFELGNEFEIALCKTLRDALPHRYGVCRGFVVNAEGDAAGDDIIIYDRARFPTLRALGDEDFSRLENIPVEAVYAYLEAKHALALDGDGEGTLQHAVDQVGRVKSLCSQRSSVPLEQLAPHIHLDADLFTVSPPEGFPACQNPVYGAVIARRIRRKAGGEVIETAEEIRATLAHRNVATPYPPDAVWLGSDVVALPVITRAGIDQKVFAFPFVLAGQSRFSISICPGLSFGVGLCLLLYALDTIQLGSMQWARLIDDGVHGS